MRSGPRLSAENFDRVERYIRTKITHPTGQPTRERNLAICRELLVEGKQNKIVSSERQMSPQRVHAIMAAFLRRARAARILVEWANGG
jgi:hypothetical protein